MKRKTLIFLTLILATIFLCACSDAMEKRKENVSELREDVLVYADEKVKVSIFSGTRENPYEVNGQVGKEKTLYTVINVDGSFADSDDVKYTLYLGDKSYDGFLTKHPFKESYSTELPVKTLSKATLTITSGQNSNTYELKSVKTDKTISASDALQLAEKRLKKSIKKMEKGDKLNCEIYVRLIENPISSEGGYYWYVAYVPEKYTVYALLIHSVSGEIVAVRE